jgi:hypothetical protein
MLLFYCQIVLLLNCSIVYDGSAFRVSGFGFRVSGSVLLQLNWQAASTAATATIQLFAVLFGSHSVVIQWSFGGHSVVIRWSFDGHSVVSHYGLILSFNSLKPPERGLPLQGPGADREGIPG